MNPPKWKTLMKRYGLMLFGVSILTFFIMITFDGRYDFPTFFGDVRIGKAFYLPFGSSIATGLFVTILFEAYKMFKHV
jgi:hypothetical protein